MGPDVERFFDGGGGGGVLSDAYHQGRLAYVNEGDEAECIYDYDDAQFDEWVDGFTQQRNLDLNIEV